MFWTYLSVAEASLNQLRGPKGASDVNSRVVFTGANISSISGCQFKYLTANWISSSKGEDFISSKAMKSIEMDILNVVHPPHVFSFKLTKTSFEAFWLKFGCWSLRMSLNFSLPSRSTTIKTFFFSCVVIICPENKSAMFSSRNARLFTESPLTSAVRPSAWRWMNGHARALPDLKWWLPLEKPCF